jgi:glycosyltransferase involved in cell wall biosynthesis
MRVSDALQHVGVVVIGRNEGDRLRQCLLSVRNCTAGVVYVDSGSSDGSVGTAQVLGAHVIELDTTSPFTAARARNAGISHLRALFPSLQFVQVVDGDCIVAEGWLNAAVLCMQQHENLAVVCGRRREQFLQQTIYNQLCDAEWNTPVGEAASCGGDALIRLSALEAVGGYDDSVIAGEEPELCWRLRQRNWRVFRIDQEMTLHDGRLMQFSQWWRRMIRSGHAYAQGWAMHGRSDEHFCARPILSIVTWSTMLPLLGIALAWWSWGLSIAVLILAYVALYVRIRRSRRRHGDDSRTADLYAQFCVLGKFAQMQGVVQYLLTRLRKRPLRIIEYKGPDRLLQVNPEVNHSCR